MKILWSPRTKMQNLKYFVGSLSSNLILKFSSIKFHTFDKERFINDYKGIIRCFRCFLPCKSSYTTKSAMNGDRFAPIVFLFSWASISTPLTKKDSLSAQPNFLRFGLGQSAQSNFMFKLNTTMVDHQLPSVVVLLSLVSISTPLTKKDLPLTKNDLPTLKVKFL